MIKILINFTVSYICFSDSFDSKVTKYFPLITCEFGTFSEEDEYNKGPYIIFEFGSIFRLRTNFNKKFKIMLFTAKGNLSFMIIEVKSYLSSIK